MQRTRTLPGIWLLTCLLVTMAASAATINVPADQPTIQAGINAAVSGVDEVVVAPGTYPEVINFNGKAITLRSSDGPAVTTIDGTGPNDSVVKCVSGEASDTVLQGFTITGGSATDGGGMYISSSSPTVTNCTFTGNEVTNYGAGMYNENNSSPTITNCTFSGNSATAYHGGGMFNDQSSPTVRDCTFSANSAADNAGGMYNRNNSNPTVTNCMFLGNVARFGGGMFNSGSSPEVTNCTFSGNIASRTSAGDGGGMFSQESSSPKLTNCTFVGNSAYNFGGGISDYDGTTSHTVTNCIMWDNTPDQISGSATVTYSDVEGGYAGTGNISSNPRLVDADGADNVVGTEDDDLHLLCCFSPCTDAGDNAAPNLPATDLDGNARIGNGTVDMGAYENCGYSPADLDKDCDVDVGDFLIFSNCFNGALNPPRCP